MLNQHFARLELERLEEVALPNMLWGAASPFLFLNDAASEPPSFVAPQYLTQSGNQAHVRNSILADSSQPRLRFLRSDAPVHSDAPSATSRPSTQNTSFALATDDLTDPLNTDFFAIDLLVGSKARGPSFVGRDSAPPSAPVGTAANPGAVNSGTSIPAANTGLSGGFGASSPGTMGLSNNPVGPATLLLSPGHGVAPIPRASQNISPSPLTRPDFASGPDTIGGGVSLTLPSYVPVNADNDNGSSVDWENAPGIPTKRDFNVAPLPVKDPELLPGNVTAIPPGGSWSIWFTWNGAGRISFWTDQKKSAPWTFTNAPGSFYVEGDHESSALNDITVTFYYKVNNITYQGSQAVTVTPVIVNPGDFKITPSSTKASIWFVQGNNAVQGLTTLHNGAPGATFYAKLADTNLSGNPVFIQNVTDVKNGALGPTTFNGNRVGATFTLGTNPASQNMVITNTAQFPVLDTPTNNGNPEYPLTSSTNNGSTAVIQSNDSPEVGPTANANNGTAIDVQDSYKLYLLWKYPSGIYYPLAYYLWWVQWYATGPGPVNNIVIPWGVGTDVMWFASNATPGKLIGPIANDSFDWQPP